MKRRFLEGSLWILLAWFLGLSARAQSPVKLKPTPAKLRQAGELTLSRILTNTAVWKVDVEFLSAPSSPRFQIIRAERGEAFRVRVFLMDEERSRIPLFSVIQKGGFWYVRDGETRMKTRPFGASFSSTRTSLAYLLLAASELIVPRIEGSDAMEVEEMDEVNCRYRRKVGAEDRRSLNQALKVFEETERGTSRSIPARVKSNMDWIREALGKGIPYRVSLQTGLLNEHILNGKKRTMTEFEWQKETDEALFVPPPGDWTDYAGSLLPRRPEDCVLVAHDPLHSGGGGEPAADSFLLDLSTGDMRRLPVNGVSALPGCFLKGRRQVLTTRVDFNENYELVMVDLESGKVSELNTRGPVHRTLGFPALSSDGKSVVMLEMGRGPGLLDFTVLAIDLESFSTRSLSKPGRFGAPLSALPDGDGFILKRFAKAASTAPDEVEPRVICKLDSKGRLTDLKPGDSPLVLPKQKRILFQEEREWFTCDLEGRDVRRYANGMKGYGQPALSPEGNRMLWVKFAAGASPKLYLFDFDSAEGRLATSAPGYTGLPVW